LLLGNGGDVMRPKRIGFDFRKLSEATNIYVCKRCGHVWKARKGSVPKVCPKCKSPYWNKEKILRFPMQWYERHRRKIKVEA